MTDPPPLAPTSPRPLPIPAAKDSDVVEIERRLAKDPAFRPTLEACAKEVQRLFPRHIKIELSLDEDFDDGLYVEVTFDQNDENPKAAKEAFSLWVIRANRRMGWKLASVFWYQ
jgi:hypothetical protein